MRQSCVSLSKKKREKPNKPHISNKLSSPEFTHLVEAHGSSRKEDLLLQGPLVTAWVCQFLWMLFIFPSSASFCCVNAGLPNYSVSSIGQALGLLFCPQDLEGYLAPWGVPSTVGDKWCTLNGHIPSGPGWVSAVNHDRGPMSDMGLAWAGAVACEPFLAWSFSRIL